ncbi:MAG: hypothetical protein ACD_23C00462G0002 [uncultured bacterium]|nr:MAG: hypothetical protein ACD_23C00462G0002 [uncultured bacterium]
MRARPISNASRYNYRLNVTNQEAGMSEWVREHFRDAQHARDTIAFSSLTLGAIGFLMVLGCVLQTH